MALKDKMTWFYALDERMWGDKIEVNPYFSTVCLMLAGLWGAVVAVMVFFSSGSVDKDAIALISEPLLLLWVMTVGESVMSATKVYVGVLRSLLFLLIIPLLFMLGVALSVIVMIAIALWLLAMILSGALKGGFSSSSSSSSGSGSSSENEEYVTGDYGEKITLDKGITGDYRGSDGHDYENLGGGYVRRKDD